MKTKINWKEDNLRLNRYSDIKVKCKHCGHTNVMPVFVEERICSWCKNKVTNNTKAHFIYKLRNEIGGNKYERKVINGN